jgi:hypothetical protein
VFPVEVGMRERTGLRALVLVGALLVTSGCEVLLVSIGGAALGAGAVAYVRGELETTLASPLARVHAASQGALDDLQFAVSSSDRDAVYGEIRALTVDDRRIKLEMNARGKEVTELRIRVGMFGDEEVSRRILDRLKARL